MKGGAQVVEREVVPTPELTRLPEALADDVRRKPIVFIAELAMLLETSERTILRQLRAGTFFIQETPKVDHRHRWSRARVYLAIFDSTIASHRKSLLGPRPVPQRKATGEAAREGGDRVRRVEEDRIQRGPISTTAPGNSAAAEPGKGKSAGSATDGHESALRGSR
jgi:hypothetical protein